MDMQRRVLVRGALIVALIFMVATACATFKTNSFKVLSVSAATYDATMKSAADLYRQGELTNDQKDKAIELGRSYWAAYHSAVAALAAYETTNSAEDEKRAETAITAVSVFLGEFLSYVEPLIAGR